MQVGIEGKPLAEEEKCHGKAEKADEYPSAGGFGGVDVAGGIQLDHLPLSLVHRHKYRQENQHKQDGSHQHHRPYEAKIVKGLGFQQKKAEESPHGCDIAGQKRAHLLLKGLPAVRLVFQMVYVMQRIVDGDADNRAADSEDYQTHALLEAGYDAQGKYGPGRYGKKDPKHVLHAFVTEPQHDADKKKRYSERQDGICLDAAGILHSHFRAAGRSDLNRGTSPAYIGLDLPQGIQQDGIPATFRTAVGRIEKEKIHPFQGFRLCLLQAGKYRGIQAQGVCPQVSEGKGIIPCDPFAVFFQLVGNETGNRQEGIHPDIILLLEKIRPVGAEERKSIGHLFSGRSFIGFYLRKCSFPAVLESVEGLPALLVTVPAEKDHHLVVSPAGKQLLPGIPGQEGRYVFLKMQTGGTEAAKDEKKHQQSACQPPVGLQPVE